MVKIHKLYVVLLFSLTQGVMAQPDTLTIQYCYKSANELSPLKKQELLNQQIFELSHQNQGSSYLPNLLLDGKATYQSDVITIPGTNMIGEFPVIPKEQYQVSLNLQQNIYDAGISRYSKVVDESQLQVNQMSLETQLYKVREQINALYYTYLQLQESQQILQTTLDNLINQRKTIEASVNYGVILKSNLFNIDKQILTIEQDIISIESDRSAITLMLSKWIGISIDENTSFILPEFSDYTSTINIKRPEIKLFDSQKNLLESQKDLNTVQRLPRIWAFAQGGIGRPNPVNFFEIDHATFYIVGLQLNWQVFDWGKVNRNRQILSTRQEIINTQEADFIRNIDITMTKQFADLDKLKTIIDKDLEIIELQGQVVKTSFSELNNGVITATEYLTELNALTQAKIKKVLHEIELSKTYITIYTTSGNEL